MKAAAIIVAHPDDEIIWCGGLILQNPTWDWTVLSLCRGSDGDRARRFAAVCNLLDVTGYIDDVDDSEPLADIHPSRDIGRPIVTHLGEMRFDLVVTHGANGEYGHLRHRQLHAEVLDLASQRLLQCRELWTFAYECQNPQGNCRPADGAGILVPLTTQQLDRKRQIVCEHYGFAAESFEARACISPEAFTSIQMPESP